MSQLPLFPLGAVLFPGGQLNLRVFEKRYLDMVTACLKSDSPFGWCLIKHGAEVGPAAEPFGVGTFAHILECDLDQPGILQISVRGGERFRVNSCAARDDQLLFADVSDLPQRGGPLPERHRQLRETLRRALPKVGPHDPFPPALWDDATWVGGRLAELLPLPVGLKQALLEMDDATERLEVLAEFVPRFVATRSA